MKFDSLEAVLLGDEAWACELTMDELAFVGGGYGSGYGSAAPVAESTNPVADYYQAMGYREIPSSTGGASGWYASTTTNSIVNGSTGEYYAVGTGSSTPGRTGVITPSTPAVPANPCPFGMVPGTVTITTVQNSPTVSIGGNISANPGVTLNFGTADGSTTTTVTCVRTQAPSDSTYYGYYSSGSSSSSSHSSGYGG
jgi:hypothetical protein